MKKACFVFIFASALLSGFNANADICTEVSNEIASKATNIIKKQKEIYDYCSICNNAKPQKIFVKNITKDKKVYVNGNVLDLAHTYFKKDNEYHNLGIASGCIENGKYGISAKLDNLTVSHHSKETYKNQAKQRAKAISDECINNAKNDKSKTTQDMIERNRKINNCLAKAIKREIQKGFNPKQQAQMLEYFEQTRKGVWNFYNDIYTSNKYCYGQCGSITSLLAYSDESIVLMQMLESLLYLNMAKKGH